MKSVFTVAACALLLGLGACSSGNDSQSTTKSIAAKKSVFDGYVKDVNKAKQVQGKLSAAQKKMQTQLKQAETGEDKDQTPPR